MTFADKLKKLMEDLDLTQGEIHKITGIGRSSISQYLSGKNEPSQMQKQEIARALGVQETYFEMFEPAATVQHDAVVQTDTAAKLTQGTKLFIAPEIKIKPGSKIIVEQNGTTTEYSASGEPAVYFSHSEYMLELFKGWA